MPIFYLIILASSLSGCASNTDLFNKKTEETYYKQSQEAIKKKQYLIAKDLLIEQETRYPFGKYRQQIPLELMYIAHKTGDYSKVFTLANQFMLQYPEHKQVDYVYYLQGLTAYRMSSHFTDYYVQKLTGRRPMRDLTALKDAFNYFNQLIKHHPNSDFSYNARLNMINIRERLAEFELSIAQFHLKQHALIAAFQRAQQLMINFPRCNVTDQAIAIQIEALLALGEKEQANDLLDLLIFNYPNHPQLSDKKNFIPSGLTTSDRHSLLDVLTFGLFK